MYQAVKFELSPFTTENSGILSAMLDIYNFEGIYENDENITAYIKNDIGLDDILEKIKSVLADAGCRLGWDIEDIPEKNWNSVWEKNYEPVIIGSYCVIRAPFHPEYPDFKYQITIEPKMSFGTGHHPTTKLMIELIHGLEMDGKSVLDMGCGTGILAILAALLKASRIIAVDIDYQACENTRENARRNHAGQILVRQGGVEVLNNESFDMIFANINRNILLEQIKTYSAVLSRDGLLLISGILSTDRDNMLETAGSAGFSFLKSTELEGWIAMKFVRN